MSLQIYNTLTRSKEELEPLEAGRVRMYVCGPTVYDRAHIGHAMSTMIFDVIRRYLEYRNFEVRHVMNVKIHRLSSPLNSGIIAFVANRSGMHRP